MTNPASINDVIARFPRPLLTLETTAATTWLADAWVKLRRAIPGIEARMALPSTSLGYLSADEVKAVLCYMVIRVLKNPDGLRQWSEETYGQTVDSVLSSGEIYVTDQERADLAVQAVVPGGGMYSLQFGR